MNSRTRISLAAIALLFLLLCLWLLNESSAPSLSDAETDGEVEEPRTKSELELPVELLPILIASEGFEERAAPKKALSKKRANDATVVDDEDHGRYAYELEVEVVGRLGRPIAGAFVCLAPERHPSNNMGKTSANGRLRIRWRAHVGFMDVGVAAAGPQFTWTGLRAFRVTADVPEVIQLILPGEEFAVQAGAEAKPRRRYRSRKAEYSSAPVSFFSSPFASTSDGVSRFTWKAAALSDAELEYFGNFPPELRSGLRAARVNFARYWDFYGFDSEDEIPEGLVARGIVYDAFMKPAAGALVTVGEKQQTPMMGVFCDSNGAFEIAGLKPGYWHVWAGGGEFGVHREEVLIGTSDAQLGKFILDRGLDYAGELISPDNRPLVGWVAELEGLSRTELFNSVVRTGEDGRFSFANVPNGAFKIHLRPHDSDRVLPVMSMTVPTDRSYLSIRVESTGATALDVEIPNLSDLSNGRTAVRITHEASGRGMWCEGSARSHFSPGALSAGNYSVMGVSATAGASRQRRARIKDGDEIFHVDLRLPQSGTAVFEIGPRTSASRIYSVWKKGAEIDSRVATSKNRISRRMELPRGEYSLLVTRDDGRLNSIPFTIFSNQDTLVTVPAEKP